MLKPKRQWGRQVFLNDPTDADSGAVVADVSLYVSTDGRPNLDSGFQVWDCDRKVTISFDAAHANFDSRRKKVLRLQKVVNEFCDKYLKYLDEAERIEQKRQPRNAN